MVPAPPSGTPNLHIILRAFHCPHQPQTVVRLYRPHLPNHQMPVEFIMISYKSRDFP